MSVAEKRDSNTNDYQMEVRVRVQKDCTNCKNRFTSVSKFPCSECIENSCWEYYIYEDSVEVSGCDTCLHEGTSYNEMPCKNCSVPRTSMWTPKVIDGKEK